MASSSPDEFDDPNSPEAEKFPKYLPHRPGKKKSYLSTNIRNNKLRITICFICFLAMVGGTVTATIFISQGMQRISQGEAALSAMSSSPTAPQSTVTRTMMVTQTSIVTDQITIPISGLKSTIYAIATAPAAPAITCEAGDTGVTCGNLASQPE